MAGRVRARLSAVVIVAILAGVSWAGRPADAAPVQEAPPSEVTEDSCDAPGVLRGTPGADVLTGTPGADVICGLGGNDVIDGRGGDDAIYAGDGDDQVSAGDGNDQVFGDAGNDNLRGGQDDDGLWGGNGNDTLEGAEGDDGLVGGPGDDTLFGADGNDALDGNSGNDSLSSADGDDRLWGGDGTDTLAAATGTDLCADGEVISGCEQDEAVLETLASPVPVGPVPTADPASFIVDDVFPGFRLELDTNGGIYPWDVGVRPAREFMVGRIANVLAGPAFDITVPADAPPIASAQLTLPYHPDRLDGFDPAALRVYTFDEDSQFWLPVPGQQTVNQADGTVTANLTHFSVYAVLKIGTPETWAEVFGRTPLRCTGGGGGGEAADIDVTFLIDTSGSMSTNDPNGFRVDGAEAFVDAMRADDRAAVVRFSSSAVRELGLTPLDTQANRDLVDAALERTRFASGGTSISSAVQEAINILSANGGDSRLRVAVLLTDGVSSYNSSLTTQAAQQGIEIHTVGLGSGVSSSLLQSIADSTGATYRQLDDPTQLPDLYEELAGDIIGGLEDDDEDELPDCQETNGLFVPYRINLPFADPIDFASFVVTDPTLPDTDDDDLIDGFELQARDIRDDPALAAEYSFLVDQGLTTYYRMHADPAVEDTDDDGADDFVETINGTNPLVDTDNELGIDDLDLAPFTLFQPDRYTVRPVIESRLVGRERSDGTLEVEEQYFNDDPVTYDADDNCVRNCTAIEDLAEQRSNNNGLLGFCVGPFRDCDTDEGQERDIVDEARSIQGVFDDDGELSPRFLAYQVALQCSLFYGDTELCFRAAMLEINFANVDRDAADFATLLGAGTAALPGVRGATNPETVRRIAEALRATGWAAAAGVTIAAITDVVVACIGGPVLEVWERFTPFRHPCEAQPIYSPGANTGEAVKHRVDAILEDPQRARNVWASPADRDARPFGRDWVIGQDGCTAADRAEAQERLGEDVALACDEFPNWSMMNAGPGASLMYLSRRDNSSEGGFYGNFATLHCPEVSNPVRAERPIFIVAPNPAAPLTTHSCGR